MARICRGCLKVQKLTKHIFEADEGQLVIMIKDCLSIDVDPNDGLPERLCLDCVAQLNISYQFRELFKKSDKALKSKLINNKVPKTKTVNMNYIGDHDYVKIKQVHNEDKVFEAIIVDDPVITVDNNIVVMEDDLINEPNIKELTETTVKIHKVQPDRKAKEVIPETVCHHCKLDCKTRQNFLQHMQYNCLHDKKVVKYYVCKQCKLKFSTEELFKNHMKTNHKKDKKIEAIIVDDPVITVDNNFVVMENDLIHQQNIKELTEITANKIHKVQPDRKAKEVILETVCHYCKLDCKTRQNFLQHMQYNCVHDKKVVKYYICKQCKLKFSTEELLKNHIKTNHKKDKKIERKKREGSYQCNLNTKFIEDGFEYSTSTTKKGISTRYVRCAQHTSPMYCQASGKITKDGTFYHINPTHNHDRPANAAEILQFKAALHDLAVSSDSDIREIYAKMALRYPVASSVISFRSMYRNLIRWRKEAKALQKPKT